MKILEFKPFEKNTLRGFLSLELFSGLVLHGCTLHERDGSRWVSMPAREYLKDGQKTWAPVVDFANKEGRAKFQAAALAAVDAYFAGARR